MAENRELKLGRYGSPVEKNIFYYRLCLEYVEKIAKFEESEIDYKGVHGVIL
jgi:hypothetical protein